MIATATIPDTSEIERRLEFARLPEHWGALLSIVVLVAVLYAVVWFYRREARAGVSRRARVLMAALRCAVVLVLAMVWIQPVLATYIHRRIESYTLVLLDGSASMKLSDRYRDAQQGRRVREFLAGGSAMPSGAEAPAPSAADAPIGRDVVLAHLLQRSHAAWLRSLADRNRVVVWQFGDEPHRLGALVPPPETAGGERPPQDGWAAPDGSAATSAPALPTDLPASPVTDLGRTLRQAVGEVGGAPIAGIVVVSDGGLNAGESPDVVARFARARSIPIYTIGIGDPSPPQNVRVGEVIAPANAFVRDPFSITVHLVAEGLADTTLTVELLEAEPDSERVIETQTVAVGADGRVAPVVFRRQSDEARNVTYRVRVVPLPVEAITDDNSKTFSVRVLESRMRVLLIAGGPRWDYRYLTRLLDRDKSVNVSCWLQSADVESVREGNTVITEFPRKPEQLYEYDVIVLFDPSPVDFTADWCELADRIVSEGGAGLLYVAGRQYTSRFVVDPRCHGVVEMLPVTTDPESEIILNQLGHFQSQPWPIQVPTDALDNPVVALGENPAETAEAWRRLGGVYWHYPVRRAKPLATVLMEHSNPRMHNSYGPHVLLATQFYGAGRTGYLGFDSTWRWRRYGDVYFNRFWVQLLRHLMEGKLLGGSRRGIILTDRDSFALGEPVFISARVLSPTRAPLEAPEITATVTPEEGPPSTITLTAERDRPGWFRGRLVPTRVGRVQIQIELPPAPGTAAETVSHALQIVQPNLEILRPQMDRVRLETLADNSAGGQYVEVDDADRLATMIADRNASMVVSGVPIILWDRYKWFVAAGLVGLLTIEWILRKRARLL